MDNTWEIMQIISDYNKAIKEVDKYSDERETLDELYAQALRIQCSEDCGCVMVLDDFIKSVADGSFIGYDGTGYFLDFDGNRHGCVRCDVEFLDEKRETGDYPFVLWFNK